ncbi:MAG: adenosylcobinamide-phosphate synthase CbiB [bacterium]|nr:adenosylcobinamide-phosphate synthase CbiB [bacterium]
MRYEILLAYGLDILVGDPKQMPHPVRGIGKLITLLERILKRYILNHRIAGILLVIIIVTLVYLLTFSIVWLFSSIHNLFGTLISIILIFTTLSIKSLGQEALKVYNALRNSDLKTARSSLSMIVSRDVKNLDEEGIIRATIETIAENITDGVIAPLFYSLLGGAPLAYAYKAVNTLDSMVGYKNKDYIQFGWASAKLDDLANYIPARITGILLPLAAYLLGKDGKRAFQTVLRDGKNHPSPNSGIPEAGVAGALGIRLGGLSYYQGIPNYKPYIGDSIHVLNIGHIKESIHLLYTTSLLMLIFGLCN